MRIGIFTESYPPLVNGVSTSIVMLQRALEKQGHDVFIITVGENIKYNLEENGKILRLPSVGFAHLYDYKFTSIYPIKAMNIIKKMNLDVIHTNIEFTIGVFARVVSVQLGIPLVHTYHTKWEDYTHYITKNIKVLDKLSKGAVKYLSIFFGDKTATELIVPTKKIYDLFKEKYDVKKNIHIVPTGIETYRFYKEQFSSKEINKLKKFLGLKKRDFVVLTVSRLAKEKSIDRLLINHKKILEKHPDIKFLIVGDGPDIDKLKDLCVELDIKDSVIFTGKVSLNDIPMYYQLGDVFVTASTTETQGLTVIEAMSASVPVVAVNDESFRNSVINDLSGFIFNTDDEYVEDILKLYENHELYQRISNQARILSNDFSSDVFASKVLKVYEQAIENYNLQNKKITSKIKRIFEKRKYKLSENTSQEETKK